MKNIVFDMGNVLTKYKLSDYIGTYTEDVKRRQHC